MVSRPTAVGAHAVKHAITLTGPAGTIVQTTEPTAAQLDIPGLRTHPTTPDHHTRPRLTCANTLTGRVPVARTHAVVPAEPAFLQVNPAISSTLPGRAPALTGRVRLAAPQRFGPPGGHHRYAITT
jgi:hypothetical protein